MFFYWLLWVEALGAVLRVTLFAAQSFIKLPRNKALDGGEPLDANHLYLREAWMNFY